jgi:hypothetical protein
MADITAVDLGQALAGIPVEIDNRTPGSLVFAGWLLNPETVAARALAELDSTALATPQRPPIVLHMGDTELSAIGCILAALEDLDAGAIGRVLDYVCSRKDCER